MPKNRSITLGVIVGNRNFFPDALVTEGRRDVLEVLAERDIRVYTHTDVRLTFDDFFEKLALFAKA